MKARTLLFKQMVLKAETIQMKKVRHLIFLKDVLLLTLTAFGGPQAHLTLFFDVLVKKRNYLSQEELIELNSFCNILPGPASTQTITAVGFKIGGPKLAFLTLLIWVLPATLVMTAAAISLSYLSLNFTKYLIPMTVAFVAFSAYKISLASLNSKSAYSIFIISAIACYFVPTPAVFPIILIIAGFLTSFKFKRLPRIEKKEPFKIEWANLILYASVFIGAAVIGHFTQAKPIRLFENFFRNGSLIFGGGQALFAYFLKEFVEFKGYLTKQELLSGYGLLQSLPGPIFSLSSFVGALSMKGEYGIWGALLGSAVATAGIFLPGTILIFFVIRIWERLKQYRAVKASLEGINSASAGIVTATALILLHPMIEPIEVAWINYLVIVGTLLVLFTNKVPPPVIILVGIIAGLLF